jgi:hypothetical protein
MVAARNRASMIDNLSRDRRARIRRAAELLELDLAKLLAGPRGHRV